MDFVPDGLLVYATDSSNVLSSEGIGLRDAVEVPQVAHGVFALAVCQEFERHC